MIKPQSPGAGKMRRLSAVLFLMSYLILNNSQALNIFVPSKFNPLTAKMLVVIHGCLQSPESMALGTGWNQIAERNNLIVLYPHVPAATNPIDCWNWYLPENQRADSGQLKKIIDEIDSTKKTFDLKRSEVFVTGISSGGATVAGLLACFPQTFTAGAIHSGPSYGLVQTLEDAENILKTGPTNDPIKAPCKPQEYKGSVMVIQGEVDTVVNPNHALRVIADFIGNTTPYFQKDFGSGKTQYSQSDYVSKEGRRGRLIKIKDLDHSWAGFTFNLKHSQLLGPEGKYPTKVPFFNDFGPSATNLIWDFFKQNPN